MQKFMMAIILVMFTGMLQAQPPHNPMRMHHPPEQIETLRIWKMTEFLELSEDQAAQFFPAFQAHRKEIRLLDSTEMQIRQTIAKAVEAEKTDQEFVDQQIAEINTVRRQKMTQEGEFLEQLSKYLTPEQQAKFIIFDDRFRRALRDAIRHRGMRNQ